MLELTLRLVFSLAAVVGLLLLTARFAARRVRGSNGSTIHVVQRHALTRSSAISVVSVGGRVLVLGSTEHQVNLLAELDPAQLEASAVAHEHGSQPESKVEPEPTVSSSPVSDPILQTPRTAPVPVVTGGRRRGGHRANKPAGTSGDSTLSGSLLSPNSWRQAVAAVRRSA